MADARHNVEEFVQPRYGSAERACRGRDDADIDAASLRRQCWRRRSEPGGEMLQLGWWSTYAQPCKMSRSQDPQKRRDVGDSRPRLCRPRIDDINAAILEVLHVACSEASTSRASHRDNHCCPHAPKRATRSPRSMQVPTIMGLSRSLWASGWGAYERHCDMPPFTADRSRKKPSPMATCAPIYFAVKCLSQNKQFM